MWKRFKTEYENKLAAEKAERQEKVKVWRAHLDLKLAQARKDAEAIERLRLREAEAGERVKLQVCETMPTTSRCPGS